MVLLWGGEKNPKTYKTKVDTEPVSCVGDFCAHFPKQSPMSPWALQQAEMGTRGTVRIDGVLFKLVCSKSGDNEGGAVFMHTGLLESSVLFNCSWLFFTCPKLGISQPGGL